MAATSAATSTTAWLAHATVRPAGAAHADVKLAASLDESFEATRVALAGGAIDGEKARVVVRPVESLPAEVVEARPDLPRRAELHLLDLARGYDVKRLRHLSRHLLEVLDRDGADERLGTQLEAEEARAARRTSLELRDNRDGTRTASARISTLHATMLKKMLEAILNPRRTVTGSVAAPGQSVALGGSRPEQMGHAFCQLLERMPATWLPQSGGVSATVVVTMDLDRLLSGLGTASLDTGDQISAGQARRLACEPGVIPAVVRRLVDGSSVVLDMGRERRLHTKHMRVALALQQGGCTADGCLRPPGWCHAHHDVPYARGGPTSVANGRLLCVPPRKGSLVDVRHEAVARREGPVQQADVRDVRSAAVNGLRRAAAPLHGVLQQGQG